MKLKELLPIIDIDKINSTLYIGVDIDGYDTTGYDGDFNIQAVNKELLDYEVIRLDISASGGKKCFLYEIGIIVKEK